MGLPIRIECGAAAISVEVRQSLGAKSVPVVTFTCTTEIPVTDLVNTLKQLDLMTGPDALAQSEATPRDLDAISQSESTGPRTQELEEGDSVEPTVEASNTSPPDDRSSDFVTALSQPVAGDEEEEEDEEATTPPVPLPPIAPPSAPPPPPPREGLPWNERVWQSTSPSSFYSGALPQIQAPPPQKSAQPPQEYRGPPPKLPPPHCDAIKGSNAQPLCFTYDYIDHIRTPFAKKLEELRRDSKFPRESWDRCLQVVDHQGLTVNWQVDIPAARFPLTATIRSWDRSTDSSVPNLGLPLGSSFEMGAVVPNFTAPQSSMEDFSLASNEACNDRVSSILLRKTECMLCAADLLNFLGVEKSGVEKSETRHGDLENGEAPDSWENWEELDEDGDIEERDVQENSMTTVLRKTAQEAHKLREEVFEILMDGASRTLEEVLSFNSIGNRFKLLFGDHSTDDDTCKKWLSSLKFIHLSDDGCVCLSSDEQEALLHGMQGPPDEHDVWVTALCEKARNALKLEGEIIEFVAGAEMKDIDEVLAFNNIGVRFNVVHGFSYQQPVEPGMFKNWLASIQDLELLPTGSVRCRSGEAAAGFKSRSERHWNATQKNQDAFQIDIWLNDGRKTWKQVLLDDGAEPLDELPDQARRQDSKSATHEADHDALTSADPSPPLSPHSDGKSAEESSIKNATSSTRVERASEQEQVRKQEDSAVIVWTPAPSPGPFQAPNGMKTAEASKLERDVTELIANRAPCAIAKLQNIGNVGVRFNTLFFRGQAISKIFWKRWLFSLPDVELVNDPSDPENTYARLRSGNASNAGKAPDCQEAFKLLTGSWKSSDGSLYEVTECYQGRSLSVKLTRPNGQSEFRRGVIMAKDGVIVWGSGFKLSQVSQKTVAWHGTRRNYEWIRVKD